VNTAQNAAMKWIKLKVILVTIASIIINSYSVLQRRLDKSNLLVFLLEQQLNIIVLVHTKYYTNSTNQMKTEEIEQLQVHAA
jgi:hypothetical protein